MTTSLITVLRNKQFDLAIQLINEGADVHAKDTEGQTPLNLAIKLDHAEIIKLLIEKGADVCIKPGCTPLTPLTPLHVAAYNTQNVQIFKLLIEAGADVNAKDYHSERTPLHYNVSLTNKNVDVCIFMLNAGAKVDARDHFGQTPLHRAVGTPHIDVNILKILIKAGADVQAKDRYGATPLHWALYFLGFKNFKTLSVLLEAGANVNEKNCYGQTPLKWCLEIRPPDINGLKFLLQAGYNVNDDDESGETSLTVMIDMLGKEFLLDEEKVSIKKSIQFFISYCDIGHVDSKKRNVLANILEKKKASKNSRSCSEIILQHIAKMMKLDMPINSVLIDVIEAHNEYTDYFLECLQELEVAKSTKLDKCWVSFFNLLVDDEAKLVKYAGNKNLVEDFEKRVKNFPIYEIELRGKISAAIEARTLYNAAAEALSDCCPIFDAYHLILRDTLNILNEEDWKNLSEEKL